MGCVLTPSGAVAGDAATCGTGPMWRASRLVAEQPARRWDAVVDEPTTMSLRAVRRVEGSVQVDVEGEALSMRKTMQPNGDFNVRIKADDDILVLVRTGTRLRVSRQGQTAVVAMEQADQPGLDQVQRLLAGSVASRRFRSMRSALSPDSISTAPGLAVDLVDAWLGMLQGDRRTLSRRPSPRPGGSILAVSLLRGDGGTCYSAWEGEVVAAWDDWGSCLDDFAWWNPLRDLCAFQWLIRVESAWFKLIGCSSIPLQ